MPTTVNIGEASKPSGVSAKMIRHYESVGLLPEAVRTESGYRQYTEREVNALRFIRQSRELGFSIDQIRELLGLWQNRRRPSRQVKALALAHIEELDQKLRELQSMRATLAHLAHCCQGNDRPECPILDTLADPHGLEVSTTPGAPSAKRGLRAGRSRSTAG